MTVRRKFWIVCFFDQQNKQIGSKKFECSLKSLKKKYLTIDQEIIKIDHKNKWLAVKTGCIKTVTGRFSGNTVPPQTIPRDKFKKTTNKNNTIFYEE